MDPGWPANPPGSLVCVLCKAAVPFTIEDSDQFCRHLMMDHSAYFNLNLLVELSTRQPGAENQEETVSSSVHDIALKVLNEITPPGTPEEVVGKPRRIKEEVGEQATARMEADSTTTTTLEEDNREQTFQQLKPVEKKQNEDVDLDFDFGFFINQINNQPNQEVKVKTDPATLLLPHQGAKGDTFIPFASKPVPLFIGGQNGAFLNPLPTEDFSLLDPISFVAPDPRKKTRQQMVNKNNQPLPTPLPVNPNRHLVPEELQRLIIENNPTRGIKFTYSQRLNTQMVVNDYVLKKKKGPYMAKGGRVVNWKCTNDKCQYTAVTWEGQVQDSGRQHNHVAQPELYAKKQARFKIKENMVDHLDQPASNLVDAVVGDTHPEMREMIGSIDALKQAARRYTRKLKGVEPRSRGGGSGNSGYRRLPTTFLPSIPGLNPDTQEFEIINDNINVINEGDTFEIISGTEFTLPVTHCDFVIENDHVTLEEVSEAKMGLVEEFDVDMCELETPNLDIGVGEMVQVEDEVLDENSEELSVNELVMKTHSIEEVKSLNQSDAGLAMVFDQDDQVEELLEPSPVKLQPIRDEFVSDTQVEDMYGDPQVEDMYGVVQ